MSKSFFQQIQQPSEFLFTVVQAILEAADTAVESSSVNFTTTFRGGSIRSVSHLDASEKSWYVILDNRECILIQTSISYKLVWSKKKAERKQFEVKKLHWTYISQKH